MNINIRAHHVEITTAIKEYLEKKLGKLDKYFEHIQEISADLDVLEVADQDKRQKVSVTLWVSGSVIRGQEASRDMYASIDLVFSKLEKQLLKHKGKLKHRSKTMKNSPRNITNVMKRSAQSESKPQTEEKNHYIPKPMHPEDAALHLESDGLNFLVFRNASDEKINVIYVLEDGDYGLIEP